MSAFIPESDSEDELPPGWEERATVEGSVYYANHTAKTTQWTHPRTGRKKRVAGGLPFGWERKVLNDGKVVFVDHEGERTTYTDPRLAFAVEENDAKKQFRQRFDASTTALQILHGTDLSEKVVVVTGASSGIGFETARSAAYSGANVVFACRTQRAADEATARARATRKGIRCVPMQVDLTSLRSVKLFAEAVLSSFDRLDVLVLNAGVFGLDFGLTPDNGCEEMFQVNFLSQFYLAHLLKERMSKTCLKPKMVVLTSESHRFSRLNEKNLSSFDPNDPAAFASMCAYNDSKLFHLCFGLQAAEEWSKLGIRCLAVHPGNMVSTRLPRHWLPYRAVFTLVRPFTKSLQQAAGTVVFAAFAPEMVEATGVYVNNCFPCEPSEVAADRRFRLQCWAAAAKMLKDRLWEVDCETAKKL